MRPLADLIGESPGIAAVREKVARLLSRQADARRLPPILIQGETGTGKGLLALAIHRAGPRADGPFVDVSCAAIPETLLEAELFGFERGAFTDAHQAKPGLFQVANRGTIFLDEVGLLPEALQGKLLQVLEARAVRRLGSTRSEPVDAWILTATNEDLRVATRARRFREDLYHRLAVLSLWLPPLRERGRDILLLAEHFLARASADYNLPPNALAPDAREALLAYRWPGNIRELSNVMERVALLSDATLVTAELLGLPEAPLAEAPEAAPPEAPITFKDAVGNVERVHLLEALLETDWNISRAAARLGISRNTLRYRIEKHGLRPGASLSSPPRKRAEPAASPPAGVRAAVPREIATPAGVRWERRRVTLLYAVLVSAGEETLALDSTRQVEVLREKVQSFGGRVEELSPTGVVGAFGLEPVEDAPRRAALSAMAIQKALEHARRGDTQGFMVKVGIHTGRFMVGGNTGGGQIALEDKRQAWRVLEALLERAQPDSIAVSASTAAFLERRFDLEPLGSVEGAPGQAYRLAGRERVGLAPAGRMAQFVGRHHEIELLRSRFASAMRGQGQVVGVVGEPGIGKSRLLFEFRRSLDDEPAAYLEGHCLSYGSDVPYLPVLDILRASCGITDADTPEAMAGKLRAGLQEVGIDPVEGGPYLLHLLGSKDGTDRLAGLDPEVIKARVFDILRQMSLKRSRDNPLIIAVEDLHWVDKTSEEYLASLVETIPRARILLISTYRPGYHPPWIEKSYMTQMSLEPLTPEDSLSVVRSVIGSARVAEALIALVLAKGEGNPFFLEELAHAVRERGGGSAPLTVPDTIEEVLRARIDWLPSEVKQLLQSAAVIGKDVPLSLLHAVADVTEDALRRGLMDLQAAEFLYMTSRGPESEYTFKHPLTHEVAYGSLPEDRRRVLHARIVEAIERLYPDRLPEQIERLAHHAFHAEVWGKAVGYLRQAGRKAAARSAYQEAVAYFKQALVALKHLPESRENLEQGVDLRFDLRTSLAPLGEFGRISEYLREGEDLAATLDDQQRLGWVCAYLTDYSRQIGDYDRAIEYGRRGQVIAVAHRDFALQVATNIYLGQVHHNLGDYRTGSAFLRKNVDSLVGELIRERFGLPYVASVHSRTWLAWCLAETGEFADGVAMAEEGLRIVEALDHPSGFTTGSMYSGLGRVLLRKGDLGGAIAALERGLQLSGVWNIRLWLAHFAGELGYAYALSGRSADALPLLQQAIEEWRIMRGTAGQSVRLVSLGEAHVLAGRIAEALELAERALDLARTHRERGNQAYALRLLGQIASRRGPERLDEAEGFYRQGMALAEELGMRPLLADCHLGLGALYGGVASRADADRHLSAAGSLFREMDMPFWLEQAEAQRRALGSL